MIISSQKPGLIYGFDTGFCTDNKANLSMNNDEVVTENSITTGEHIEHPSPGITKTYQYTKITVGEIILKVETILTTDKSRAVSRTVYWLLKPDGEGMTISAKELEKMLQQYYEENF